MPTTTLPRLRRFTVSEYYAMSQSGILKEDDRVELLNGTIIAMSPIGSRHAERVRTITALFYERVYPKALISVQDPIRLDNRSEPGPDLALLVPKDVYAARHPRPDEVLLVVEVSVTTLAFDRDVKLPLYARAGIPEVWLLALDEDRLYLYRQPGADGYAETRTLERGDTVNVTALPEVSFDVADLLGA